MLSYVTLVQMNLRISDLSEVMRLTRNFDYPKGVVHVIIGSINNRGAIFEHVMLDNQHDLLNKTRKTIFHSTDEYQYVTYDLGLFSKIYEYRYLLEKMGPDGDDVIINIAFDDTSFIHNDVMRFSIIWLINISLLAAIYLCFKEMSSYLLEPLANTANFLQQLARINSFDNGFTPISHSLAGQSLEVQKVIDGYNTLLNKLKESYEHVAEIQVDQKISKVASQVAHDIRSPLAALTVVTQELSEIPEDKRIMVRSAVQRISDIANDLADRGDQGKSDQTQNVESDKTSVELLTSIIDSLVSEKRLQYRARLGINIAADLGEPSYGLFAKIQLAQFKRVLSNLVNNAVEAITDVGSVVVKLSQNKDYNVEISVADTGKGIAPENLDKLMQPGASFGKKDGQGLGLFHARESVESWDGRIEITSCQTGTAVMITLPRQNEPDWFVPELFIYEKMTVIILDDDESIHQIWKSRFELATQISMASIEMHHFPNGDDLRKWRTKQNKISGPMLILCDYEILGSSETGLDIIKELRWQDYTVLVTSRFEEKHVSQQCKNLGIRLLPKNLAGFVPIKFKEIGQDLQYVLIDDSRMNRQMWELMAKRNQKKIATFERPKNFYDVAEKINKDVKLYVDLNLGHGKNGKDVTKEISEKGFKKIYLYTGEVSVDASQMPWLAGVVGKNVPFLEEKSK